MSEGMHAPFDRVETWIFDLDNTLYPPHERLFGQIERRMSAYMMRELGVDEAEATRLRRAYWHDHGTTLAGLMINHRIDPDPFLEEVHDIDFAALDRDPALRAALEGLPGRLVVYTNGARSYAGNVLEALGLGGLFEAVWTIEDAYYEPKPRESAFRRVFGKDGLDPKRSAFFEDDHRNLRIPSAMGVITGLVKPEGAPLGSAPMGVAPGAAPSDADADGADAEAARAAHAQEAREERQEAMLRVAPDPAAEIPAAEAPALAAAAEAAAKTAPIRPPAEDVPPHVDYVVRDLARFLSALTDPGAEPPRPAR